MADPADVGRRAIRSFHEARGAVFEPAGDRETVAHYGDPDRAHLAVRAGVGVTEVPVDVVVLTGSDRRSFLNNVVTNVVPATAGRACSALLLDPQGRIRTDMTVLAAGERLLVLTPPGVADGVVDGWETFIQDVEVEVATDAHRVVDVHGPAAAGALAGVEPPAETHGAVEGTVGGADAWVLRTDAPAGEVGVEVVCAADDAQVVLETLLAEGDAVPFGRATWRTLTLEAGTPLFESELAGRVPNVAGARAAVDFEKGCFVGQEVVSKVENVGRPSRRLVGLRCGAVPDAGAPVTAGGEEVGEVTRSAVSPSLEAPIAMAYVDFGLDGDADLAVEADGNRVGATVEPLPFVEGSERSGRIPRYPD